MKYCPQCGKAMVIVMSDKHAQVYECLTCGHREMSAQKYRRKRVGPSEVKA